MNEIFASCIAEALLAEVSGAYAACRLGPHMPAPGAVVTFTAADAAAHQGGGGGGDDDGEEWGDAAALLVRLPEADCAAIAALRGAAPRLQQRLLLDPPPLRHGVTSLTLTWFMCSKADERFLSFWIQEAAGAGSTPPNSASQGCSLDGICA